MLSLRVLGFCVLSTFAPLAIGCSAETAEQVDTDDQAVSEKDRSQADELLSKAIDGAETRLAGGRCDGENTALADILFLLRQATKLNSSKSFRKKIAESAPLRSAVGSTLDFHLITGTITINREAIWGIETAIGDSESGIEIYGPSVGVHGHTSKIRLLVGNRVVFSHRNEGETTWIDDTEWQFDFNRWATSTELQLSNERLGREGDVIFNVTFDAESNVFIFTDRDANSQPMTSIPSECDA